MLPYVVSCDVESFHALTKDGYALRLTDIDILVALVCSWFEAFADLV